jgi:hypothetical protein
MDKSVIDPYVQVTIPFECLGDMMDLVFVRFVVRRQEDKDQEEPLAVYCGPLGSLEHGMFLDIVYFWTSSPT